MPKLKTLSGSDIIKIFAEFGFKVASQKGSHVKIQRSLSGGARQSLTLPNHTELDRGTIKAIYRQASRYIPDDELRKHFYTS